MIALRATQRHSFWHNDSSLLWLWRIRSTSRKPGRRNSSLVRSRRLRSRCPNSSIQTTCGSSNTTTTPSTASASSSSTPRFNFRWHRLDFNCRHMLPTRAPFHNSSRSRWRTLHCIWLVLLLLLLLRFGLPHHLNLQWPCESEAQVQLPTKFCSFASRADASKGQAISGQTHAEDLPTEFSFTSIST